MASFQDRMDLRKKNFKKGVDSDDQRRRREDDSVQIRKAQKEAQLAKKRMVSTEEEEVGSENVPVQNNVPTAGMRSMVQQLASADADLRLTLTRDIRRAVAKPRDAPIQEAIEAGVVPAMVVFLEDTNPELQFESAWVLTNIASGTTEQTEAVVRGGAVPPMLKLLHHGQPEAQEQVVWAVSNIAGDTVKNRDQLLALNVMAPMLQLMVANETRIVMLRNVTWAISNLLRGKPSPAVEMVVPAMPYLARLVTCNDVEVCSDALWGLSYICDGGPKHIQTVLESGATAAIVERLEHKDDRILQPALRAAGNIATGDDAQTTVLLQHGIVAKLPALLNKAKKNLRKEAVWLLSNVTAGNMEQIQLVIDAQLFPRICQLAGEGAMDVRKEAVWTLCNAAMGAGREQQEVLARMGVVSAIANALGDQHGSSEMNCALDALGAFLKGGEARKDEQGGDNIYCGLIEECGGLSKIEDLQEDANEDTYRKSIDLLERYFNAEDAETEAGPEQSTDFSGATYNFA